MWKKRKAAEQKKGGRDVVATKSGACACAALSLCAKELVCLVRFSRATSEPKRIALGFDALPQPLCSTKLSICRFLSLKSFLLKRNTYTNDRLTAIVCGRAKEGAKQKRVALLFHSAPQLSLCAEELVSFLRRNRATSALEPPPCAAVLLTSAALLQINRSCPCRPL